MGRTKGLFGSSSVKGSSTFSKGGKLSKPSRTKKINLKRTKKSK